MLRYRRKIKYVEVYQVSDTDETRETPYWIIDGVVKQQIILINEHKGFTVINGNTKQYGEVGDWIIKDENNKLSICTKEVFPHMYEEVECGLDWDK